MTDDAVAVDAVASALGASVGTDASMWDEAAKIAIAALQEAGYAIVPAATIAQRDATIERLRAALKPLADRARSLDPAWLDHENHWQIVKVGQLRAARAAYDDTGGGINGAA